MYSPPTDHAPVKSPPVTVAERDTHGSTDNALCGGDGESETGSHDNGDSRSQLHRETTGGRHEGEFVTKVAHDVVTVSPETNDDTGTTVRKDPQGDGVLLGVNNAGFPDGVDGGEWANGIGNIVGTVSERGSGGSENLEEGVQVLGLVVEVSCAGVHGLNVTTETRIRELLSRDDILADTVHESVQDGLEKVLREVPRADIILLNAGERLLVDNCGSGLVVLEVIGTADSTVLKILAGLEMLHVLNDGCIKVGCLEVFLSSLASIVVLDDLDIDTLRNRGDGAAAEQKRAIEDVPSLEGPVLENEEAVKIREEEDDDKKGDGGSDTEDSTGDFGHTPVIEVKGSSTLPDDQHGQDTAGERKVERNHDESPLERVRALEHTVLGDGEEDGAESTSNGRRNNPRSNDGSNTSAIPSPIDFVGTESGHTHTNDTADDAVGGGNGQAEGGSDREPC